MTDTADPWTHVPAFEHGLLRLYAVDERSEAGRRLVEALRAEPRDAGPVDAALGAERVDPYWLDLVRLSDIAGIGLAGYLQQGYDVPQRQLDEADLATDARHVLIVPSRAFRDAEQTLSPDPSLDPLATLQLPQDVGALRPVGPVRSAEPQAASPDRAPAPQGAPARRGLRPAAILILLLIAAAFILLVSR